MHTCLSACTGKFVETNMYLRKRITGRSTLGRLMLPRGGAPRSSIWLPSSRSGQVDQGRRRPTSRVIARTPAYGLWGGPYINPNRYLSL